MRQYYLISIILWTCILGIKSKQPHIIFITVDDLGWNDVSFHGSYQIPTPNIDGIARDGLILNNYYVQPICTPSRGALMTGKYPLRLGLQHDVIPSSSPYGLSPDEKILPQYLKDLGYKTHGVGKWHLGYFQESYLPVNRGFESFFGYWGGRGDHFTHYEEGPGMMGLDFHDDNISTWNYTMKYSTKVFTSKSREIIGNHNASQPLFLYLSYQAVHTGNSYNPLQAPPEYIQKFTHIKDQDRRVFAAMTSALDDGFGDVIEALSDFKMLNQSIVVFTTDNGAAVEGIDKSTGSNWPLRGSKYNMWEGGIRGTAFIWSDSIRKLEKKVSTQLMHISDWLPTLYFAAGGDVNKLPKIDGINQWDAICCSKSTSRNMIIHNIDPVWKVESIRKKNFKLVKGSVFDGEFDGWFDKEGKKQKNICSSTDMSTQVNEYSIIYSQAKVTSILHKIYNKNLLPPNQDEISQLFEANNTDCTARENSTNSSSLVVNCGPRPENSTTNCQPMKNPCLFDIENDPCEYNNLAESKIQIVEDLEAELDKYRAQAVPIRNKPLDPNANPKFHGYAWVPWLTTP